MSANQIAVKIDWLVDEAGAASIILRTMDDLGRPIKIMLDLEQAQHTSDLLQKAVVLAEGLAPPVPL